MKCPNCGLESPSSATVCQCGCDLVIGKANLRENLAEQAQDFRRGAKKIRPSVDVKADIEAVQSRGPEMGSFPKLSEGSGQNWEVEGFGVLVEPAILQGLRDGWLTLDDRVRQGTQDWSRIRIRLRPKFEFGVLIDPGSAYGRRYSKYGAAVGVLIGGLIVAWREGRGVLATFGIAGVIGLELGYWIGKRVGTYKAKHNPLPSTRQPVPSWVKSTPA